MTTDFAARHTCDSPEWYTPSAFVEAAREVMGGIDLDPASHADANLIVRATQYYTAETDGLDWDAWDGRVFLNPPGGLVREFWTALMFAYNKEDAPFKRRVTQAIWIGYSLEQLQTLQACPVTPLDFPICITAKRIAFIENAAKRTARLAKVDAENARRVAAGEKPRARNERSDSPSHSNYITYLGPFVDRFERTFSRFGKVKR